MRVASLLTIAAALTFAAIGAAEAQTSGASGSSTGAKPLPGKRTSVIITQRSPLDAGTVVKPGTKSYLDYALPAEYFFPTYGAGQSGIVPGRYPLPDRFYLPGY